VGVVDEEEIFRLGVGAAFATDASIEVAYSDPKGPVPEGIDVAVVSARALGRQRFQCPVVVCADELPESARRGKRSRIAAVLPRKGMTAEQLVAAVRAAAAGLRVNTSGGADPTNTVSLSLDPRRREVLRLLAEGADTVAISERLCYSVRTIKSLIQDVEHELAATSRAQAVAEGIRRGII
jgi:DNA-binding NarL/FixJ family response regulator